MSMKLHYFGQLAVGILLGSAMLLGAAEKLSVGELTRELKGERPAIERTPEQLEAAYAEVINNLMPDLGNEDPGKRSGPQGTLERITFQAGQPGAEAGRVACSKVIAAKLERTAEPLGRIWLLKQLERIGRGEAVPAMAQLLADQDVQVRESARRALQKNPDPAANAALQQALTAAKTPAWQAALMNALAERNDPANLALLVNGAASEDDAVRIGALIGLAKLGDKQAMAPIAAARSMGSPAARRIAADCYVRLADALVARGDKPSALSLYQTMLDAHGYLRCAAIIGIGRAGSLGNLPTLLEAAADPDVKVRGACVEALCLLEGQPVAETIAAKVGTSLPDTKVALLQALARRGEKSTVSAFTTATADADQAVQVAALSGLGSVGTPAQVPLLLTAASSGAKPLQEAARQSLQVLPGADIDQALLGAMDQLEPKVRAEAARALAARHVAAATGVLLKAAADIDGSVRNESLKALGVVAANMTLAPLAAVLVRTEDNGSRSEAADALVSIANRSDDLEARSEPILKALETSSGPARLALLNVLGRIGGQQSLIAVRAAVKDNDPKVQDAAIRALAEWPDATAAVDLLGIVKGVASETQQVLAFRGYVRVCRIRTARKEAETAEMLAAGLAVAKRPDQKREALGGLAEVRDLLALQTVELCLEDPAVKEEAASAAVRIGREICDKNPAAVKAVMQKVLELSKNEGVQRDAREALGRAERKLKEVTPKR
jgi:HEAT repeat protein